MDSTFAVIDLTVKAAEASKASPPFWQNLLLDLLKNPGIFWVILASIVIWRFYKPLRYELLPNIMSLKAMGLEFSFVQGSITNAIGLAKKWPRWPVVIPEEDEARVLQRVKKQGELFRGKRILWIDDEPESPANERRMLERLLTDIDMAENSAKADELLQKNKYDLILSDMKRSDDNTAGLKFLQNYAKREKRVPVIFYVGYPDPAKPVPLHAFGITHRPDELLHLIMDALERIKA